MALVCKYQVTVLGPGCEEYELGEIVDGPCNGGFCQDYTIDDGPCVGTYFTALSCTCEEASL